MYQVPPERSPKLSWFAQGNGDPEGTCALITTDLEVGRGWTRRVPASSPPTLEPHNSSFTGSHEEEAQGPQCTLHLPLPAYLSTHRVLA